MKKNKLIFTLLFLLIWGVSAHAWAEQMSGTKWQSDDGDIVAFYSDSLWMWNARQSFTAARRASCRNAGDSIALWKDTQGPVYGLYVVNWSKKTMRGIIMLGFFPLVYKTDLYRFTEDGWSSEKE
jgi:hypothetical protein